MSSYASEQRLSEEELKAKKDAEAKAKIKKAELVRDINDTFSSGAGMRTLRYLMEICGYQNYVTAGDPGNGDVLANGTIYNAARHSIYIKLRTFIKQETLIKVENQGLEQDKNEVDIFS